MIATTANCPSCGGPITFKVGSSITVVCEFCGSSIARTDRDLRNLGKVADLIDTQSPLRVGLEGRLDGRPFVLTGRVQIAHQAGGVWDEWYASFGDLGWGWLAEAQGRFTMTFVRPVPDPTQIPPVQQLGPGQPVGVPGDPTRWVVGETGVGRLVSGQGEIPYAVQPGLTYAYADLSGPNGAFATLDYRNGPPVVFSGREVTLKDLGISAVVDSFDAEQRVVKVARLVCPHCNAPVELRAPDSSLRVTCASCNALLDVNRGNLSYLKTLDAPRAQRFANGSEATIDGVLMTLVGYMVRGCQVEGEWYYWEEYLLYAPAVGYRWIVNGEGGWYFVEPAAPGDVVPAGTSVRYRDKRFAIKEGVDAVVAYVRGEFYWRVEVGERARATDYVSRGEMLSQEISGSEVNWSFGRAIDPAAFDRAFDPRAGRANPVVLPPPRVVIPPKPLPSIWSALGIWLLLTVVAFGAYTVLSLGASSRVLLTQSGSFAAESTSERPPEPASTDPEGEIRWSPAQLEQTAVLGSFEVKSRRDLEIDIETQQPLGSDLYFKLVNDGTGQTRIQKMEYVYSGRSADKVYESPGPGQYTLYAVRLAPEGSEASPYKVTVKEDVPDDAWPFFASFLLLGGPALLLVMKIFRAMFKE